MAVGTVSPYSRTAMKLHITKRDIFLLVIFPLIIPSA